MSDGFQNYFCTISDPYAIRIIRMARPKGQFNLHKEQLFKEIARMSSNSPLGACQATSEYFAKKFKVNRKQITRYLTALKVEGRISIETSPLRNTAGKPYRKRLLKPLYSNPSEKPLEASQPENTYPAVLLRKGFSPEQQEERFRQMQETLSAYQESRRLQEESLKEFSAAITEEQISTKNRDIDLVALVNDILGAQNGNESQENQVSS